MAKENPPYMNAYGNIEKALKKIIEAQTPDRFTQDFLSTTLGMTGGGAMPIIPFLKRLGFLGSDGVPTERYKQFRSKSQRGAAAADAIKEGYKNLFAINERANDADDEELLEIVIRATGQKRDSQIAKSIVASFKSVSDFADFNMKIEFDNNEAESIDEPLIEVTDYKGGNTGVKLGLSYTINLNLPATSDIKVFDAIFKSLKENILK